MDNPKECIKCKENKLLENNNQANLLICSNCPTGYKCDGTQVPVECEERSKGEDGDNNGMSPGYICLYIFIAFLFSD